MRRFKDSKNEFSEKYVSSIVGTSSVSSSKYSKNEFSKKYQV